MEEFVGPIIKYRLEQEDIYGSDWSEKPVRILHHTFRLCLHFPESILLQNDIISWLMDGARAAKQPVTISDISSRILLVSFGAIHTSSAVSCRIC